MGKTGKVKFWVGKTAFVVSFTCLYNFLLIRNKISTKEESDEKQQHRGQGVHINLRLLILHDVLIAKLSVYSLPFSWGFGFQRNLSYSKVGNFFISSKVREELLFSNFFLANARYGS